VAKLNKEHLEALELMKTEVVDYQNKLAHQEATCEALGAQLQASREAQTSAEVMLREMS